MGGNMLFINYKRGILKISEEIGTSTLGKDLVKTDILIRFELLDSSQNFTKHANEKFSFRLLVPNYLIDLDEDENDIYNKIHKNTRYKINRAMKRDELLYYELTNPSNSEIIKFQMFFNPFAKERGIRSCDVNKLVALRDQGALVISYITDKDHQVLCYHAYHKDDKQGYLIYSASKRFKKSDSNYQNFIGRANRYLHWKDIQSFKRKGCKWYNFGGKVINEEDRGGQNVNKFKVEYGPITTGYDSRTFHSKSLIGKFGILLLYLKWKQSPEYKFTRDLQAKKLLSNYESHNI
jgi:hypothetical protein